MRLHPIIIFAAASITAFLCAQSSAQAGTTPQTPPAIVRFYPQTGDHGGEFSKPVTLKHSGKQVSMGTMPLINERDIVSAHTFPAPDGSFGAYFKLDSHGTNLVMQHTLSQRGTFLFAFFNGRAVLDLYVDRPVQDGIIAIPHGLLAEEVALIEQKFPPIGQEGKKPKKAPVTQQVKPTPNPKPTPKPAP